MQIVRVVECGDQLRVCMYTIATRWDSPKARRVKREWRRLAWQKMNFRTCRQKLEDRIACNFTPQDWHGVFTLSDAWNTDDYTVLRGYWRKCLRTLREARKARGAEQPTYLYVCEGLHGDKRLHIHALLRAVDGDIEELQSCWPYGDVLLTRIADFEHRDNLAQYLTKEPQKLGRDRTDRNLFVASHNCVKPTVRSYRVPDGSVFPVPVGYRKAHTETVQNEFGCYHYMILRRDVPS